MLFSVELSREDGSPQRLPEWEPSETQLLLSPTLAVKISQFSGTSIILFPLASLKNAKEIEVVEIF